MSTFSVFTVASFLPLPPSPPPPSPPASSSATAATSSSLASFFFSSLEELSVKQKVPDAASMRLRDSPRYPVMNPMVAAGASTTITSSRSSVSTETVPVRWAMSHLM
eukprot:CAMPEP_0171643568 /NCGR_PEP_ID=MMETSP0990-20121206/32774_1 /TAXON_ID=483369 /ORGANISM="non described non described, Strain CCMP2098" /LENGTH=106 /DNA_ID=CAMNT_0012219297 /DNA_START=1631 /DNA_END=1951 /DNA_ORIENTATION=-